MSSKMRQLIPVPELTFPAPRESMIRGSPFSCFFTLLPTPPSWHHSCGILIPVNYQPLETNSSYFSWPLHTGSYGDITLAPYSKTQASLSVSWVKVGKPSTGKGRAKADSRQPSTGWATWLLHLKEEKGLLVVLIWNSKQAWYHSFLRSTPVFTHSSWLGNSV